MTPKKMMALQQQLADERKRLEDKRDMAEAERQEVEDEIKRREDELNSAQSVCLSPCLLLFTNNDVNVSDMNTMNWRRKCLISSPAS